jgi:hypothetical protein
MPPKFNFRTSSNFRVTPKNMASIFLFVLGISYLLFHFTKSLNLSATDFDALWMGGKFWIEGKNPYDDTYAHYIQSYFANQYARDFIYPFNWSMPARMLATLDIETATLFWRLTNFTVLFASMVMLGLTIRKLQQPVSLRHLFATVGVICLMQGTPVVFTLGQSSIIILGGVSLILYGVATGTSIWLTLGLVIVLLKPQIGIPITAALMAFPIFFRSIIGACLLTAALSVPAFLSHGLVNPLIGFLHNVGQYGTSTHNMPNDMTGIRNLASVLLGVDMPGLVLVAIAALAALGAANFLNLSRAKDSMNPICSILLALTIIFFIVPLHLYDFPILAPLILIVLVHFDRAWWILLLWLMVICRAGNIPRWLGIEVVGNINISAELIVSVAALLVLIGTVWLLKIEPVPFLRKENVDGRL